MSKSVVLASFNMCWAHALRPSEGHAIGEGTARAREDGGEDRGSLLELQHVSTFTFPL